MASTKKNVVEIKPDVNAQIETLRNDIALLGKTIKSQVKSTAEVKTAKAVDTATAKAAETKAKYDDLTSTAETSIRENPLTAVAVAAFAGMFIGLLSRR
jgi:ElaB/YqjD/DUF883 family membrane-anchored ribosome-binding protein